MQKKLTILFAFAIFVLVVGLSDSYAEHKKNPNAGHGGGDGDGAGTLTANLTGGTFVFDDPLPVTLNKKGNSATSEVALNMNRPDGGTEREDWDAVFNECKLTLESLEIPEDIHLGNSDWKIAANAGDIRLRLFDARLEVNAVITLELRGDPLNYDGNPVPPDDDGISQFEIDGYVIFGDTEKGVQPRDSCKLSGDLSVSSMLTICGKDVKVKDCHP